MPVLLPNSPPSRRQRWRAATAVESLIAIAVSLGAVATFPFEAHAQSCGILGTCKEQTKSAPAPKHKAAAESVPERPARSSRQSESELRNKEYSCQLTPEYSFRPCYVSTRDGKWVLDFPGTLVEVVLDLRLQSSGNYVFTGKFSEQPFFCNYVKLPGPKAECIGQTVSGNLAYRGRGRWSGTLRFTDYRNVWSDTPSGRAVTDFTTEPDSYSFVVGDFRSEPASRQ